jgi:hypothetical protein
MIIDPSFYTYSSDDKAHSRIAVLNQLRSRFVQLRKRQTLKMIKGVLDYHAINKDVFGWRMATVYQNPSLKLDQVFEDLTPEDVQKCANIQEDDNITPEQKWQLEYKLDRIVKDKIDERYAEIVAKKRDIDVRSIAFEEIKFILNSIIKPPFDTVEFDEAYRQAVIDSLKKTTGFLRVNLYNKEVNEKTLSLKKVDGKVKTTETDHQYNDIYTKVERVDPETIFVDNLQGEVNEMFVVTPYQPNELKEKFRIDAKYFVPEYTDQEWKDKNALNPALKDNKTYILPESVYHYHVGEKLVDIYDMGDIAIDEYYYDMSKTGKEGFASTIQPKECPVHVLSAGQIAGYYDGYLYNTNGYKPSYMLTEYFNKQLDIYAIYCGQVLLYEGRFMDTFGDFPVQPIYTYRKGNTYYGDLFSENLSHEQDRYNQLLHQQELSSIIMDKPTLLIGSDSLDNNFHPYGNITLKKNSPYNEIHMKKATMITGKESGNPLQPLSIPNYTNDILEGRKNTILATIERRYPSLKSLAASNSVEVQKEIIYSRDMATNEMMDQISIRMSMFAKTVFNCRIFEFRLRQLFEQTVKTIDGSKLGEDVNVQQTNEDRLKVAKDKAKKMDEAYTIFVEQETKKQIANPSEELQPIIQQISDQIEEEIATAYIQKLGKLNSDQPLSPETISELMTSDPRIKQAIDQEMLEKALPIITDTIKKYVIQKNPAPVDNTVYLTVEDVKKVKNNSSGLKFTFDKSLKEKIRNYADMMQMAAPFAAQTKFMFQPKEFLREIILSCGFDPNTMLVEKPPSMTSMVKWDQMKLNTFYNWESDSITQADFLNDMYAGQKQYTPEQLLQAHMAKFTQEADATELAKQKTLDVKTQSQMAVEGNKQALSAENAMKMAQAPQI